MISISGKTYGEHFYFRYGEFHRFDNPAGYPDEHYGAPGTHEMVNDGLLPLPPGQPVTAIDAGWLSGGVVMTMAQIPALPIFELVEAPNFIAVLDPGPEPQRPGLSAVPVPPALGLFAAALTALGATARRRLGTTWPA